MTASCNALREIERERWFFSTRFYPLKIDLKRDSFLRERMKREFTFRLWLVTETISIFFSALIIFIENWNFVLGKIFFQDILKKMKKKERYIYIIFQANNKQRNEVYWGNIAIYFRKGKGIFYRERCRKSAMYWCARRIHFSSERESAVYPFRASHLASGTIAVFRRSLFPPSTLAPLCQSTSSITYPLHA